MYIERIEEYCKLKICSDWTKEQLDEFRSEIVGTYKPTKDLIYADTDSLIYKKYWLLNL